MELDLRNVKRYSGDMYCEDGESVDAYYFDLLTEELAHEENLHYEAEKDTARQLDALSAALRERDEWKVTAEREAMENEDTTEVMFKALADNSRLEAENARLRSQMRGMVSPPRLCYHHENLYMRERKWGATYNQAWEAAARKIIILMMYLADRASRKEGDREV